MIKKILGFIFITLVFTISSVNVMAETDFSSDEDYYYNLCSSTGLSESDKTLCRDFQDYLNKKASDINNELAGIKNDLADIRSNLQAYLEEMATYQAQITSLESDISKLNNSIEEVTRNIEVLESRIKIREDEIAKKREEIASRMIALQGGSSVSGYIDFLFGASDFSDFIRRAEAINDITSYNRDQILALQEEIKLLNQDKDDLQTQKVVLEEQKTILETNISNLEKLKERVELIIIEYRKKEAEYMELQDNTLSNLNDVKESLSDVSEALNRVSPSTGWIFPVASRFYVSAGAWKYPSSFGGGIHLAADMAASIGTKIVAPANGIILYVVDNCQTVGYYGSSCGSPGIRTGGNQIGMIVQVGNKVYSLVNFHLKSGVSKYVKSGDVVQQGDLIAYMGSSGSSTGSHLHQQIVYLGENNMEAMINKFKSTGDITFGQGWGWTAYGNRCSKGGVPCYINPQDIYNVKVGRYYN